MNITLIPDGYLPMTGGGELVVYNLSKQLLKKGHNVNIITPRYPRFKSRELIDGIIVDRVSICSTNASLIRRVGFTLYAVCKIWRLLKKNRTEIMQIHYVGFLAFSILLLSYIYKFKLVVRLSGSDVLFDLLAFASARNIWVLRKILKRADYVVTCSHSLLIDAQKRIPEIKGKSTVIYNGVDRDKFNRAKKYIHTRPYILSVANFKHYKGQDILIMAFKDIAEKYKNIDLILVGDGKMKENCQQFAGLLKLQDKVIFMGRISDRKKIAELFNGCEFFVLPSRYETFGIVNLEAMAAGKAILATNTGGVPEFVKNGINGILVNPKEDKTLTEEMMRLLEDVNLRNRLGENGKKMANWYSWQRMTDEYLNIYRKILNESRKRLLK